MNDISDFRIAIGEKYGCLTVVDSGEEYQQTEFYSELLEKKVLLEKRLRPFFCEIRELKSGLTDTDNHIDANDLNTDQRIRYRCLIESNWQDLCEWKKTIGGLETHYKCICKCGKFHYYNLKTIEGKPRFCFYPLPISTRYTYSNSAKNATYRKREKYSGIESVVLRDKSECNPSEIYCALFNKYKEKQKVKKEEKDKETIARIPRVYAKNYDVDFTGKQYESLLIETCIDEHLESQPREYYTQSHHKKWHKITVYKQYKCICTLCGKELLVTCDKFGIFPPTEYGYNAYNGYWSDVHCDCHPISSFQWIVNKILFDNNIHYQVEYTFDDLYGTYGINKLRYDFAILERDGSIKFLIECQGEQHYSPVEEFGGNRQYIQQKKNDELKRRYALEHGIKLIEISFKDKQYEKVYIILKNELGDILKD